MCTHVSTQPNDVHIALNQVHGPSRGQPGFDTLIMWSGVIEMWKIQHLWKLQTIPIWEWLADSPTSRTLVWGESSWVWLHRAGLIRRHVSSGKQVQCWRSGGKEARDGHGQTARWLFAHSWLKIGNYHHIQTKITVILMKKSFKYLFVGFSRNKNCK